MSEVKFRDPVHNFIRFDGEEVKLINLPILQRLRGIRQLAMASLVYPGAVHTRFEHSLGVTHVAGQMADNLHLDSDEKQIVRLAALLHDIGHGPFSHISEYALDRFGDRRALPKELREEKIHEIVTGHLIRNDAGLLGRLGSDRCNEIATLLSHGFGDPVLRSIVSGPLDSDKQDYLLRDSHYAGVTYGVFDIHQLQRSLICDSSGGAKELMIRSDGVHAIEQFVLAKYYLTTMVYRHKLRSVTDQMIVRAIILGIEADENKELEGLYRFEETGQYYGKYLKWNDARFLSRFGESGPKGAKCTELLQRLITRNLLKRVFYAPAKDFSAESRERLLAIGKPENSKLRRRAETQIAKAIAKQFQTTVDRDFTILHTYQIQSVRESSRNSEASILVAKAALRRPFEEESTLFSSINERMADEYVEVYAPVSWANHSDRDRHKNALEPVLKEIIANETGSIQLSLRI
jgi:HD superfamily phosphohydrolase